MPLHDPTMTAGQSAAMMARGNAADVSGPPSAAMTEDGDILARLDLLTPQDIAALGRAGPEIGAALRKLIPEISIILDAASGQTGRTARTAMPAADIVDDTSAVSGGTAAVLPRPATRLASV